MEKHKNGGGRVKWEQREKENLEDAAIALIRALQTGYLEQRDMSSLLPELLESTSWIGTGADEVCTNLADARNALAQEFAEYPGRFLVTGAGYTARALSKTVCLVYGSFFARPEQTDMANLDHRLTAVCKQTEQGLKIAHLHVSRPDITLGEGRYYANRDTTCDQGKLQQLRADEARQLEERSRQLVSLTENIPAGMHQCRYDAHLTLLEVSQGFLALVGYSREEIATHFHNRFLEMIEPEDRAAVAATVTEQMALGDTVQLNYRVRHKNGAILWILDKGKLAPGLDGSPTFFCLLLDVTEERRSREALRLSLERHEIIMNQTTDIIFEWDIIKDALTFSANWRKKFGYDPIQENISGGIPFSENIHRDDMPTFIKLMEDTADGVPYSEAEFRIRDAMGEFTWCRIRATTQYDGQHRPVKAVGVISDIDADKKHRQHLLKQAQTDALTGLLNKTVARQLVDGIIAQDDKGHGALFIIDIDDFKGINDHYGHLCGDTVLAKVAGTLKGIFRVTDVLARVGGDEFLVFMEGGSPKEAGNKASQLLELVRQMEIQGRSGRVSCSVGVALWPEAGSSFLSLYRRADLALYRVKNNGKSGVSFYADDMIDRLADGGSSPSAVNAHIESDG